MAEVMEVTQMAAQSASLAYPNQDPGLVELLGRTRTESGRLLLDLLDERPMLLVFLRHLGCSFARESIADVARARPDLDARGVRPVFIHMAQPERAQRIFRRYGMESAERVSDPGLQLYQAPVFHLLKNTVLPEYFALGQISNFFGRGLRHGFGSAGKGEDPTQLPGVFFLRDRHIVKAFRHKMWTDRPDYPLFGI